MAKKKTQTDFILIQGGPGNTLSTERFNSLGQLHESLVKRYFRELKKEHKEEEAKQIIIDETNRATIFSRKRG